MSATAWRTYDNEVRPFWTPAFYAKASSTTDAAALAAEHLTQDRRGRARGSASSRGSCPPMRRRCWRRGWKARASSMRPGCWSGCGRSRRRRSSPSSGRGRSSSPTRCWRRSPGRAKGRRKAEIIERLRREEVGRGLHFDYCLLTLGASHNRAPSEQAWAAGEVLSIDSGGNLDGYIGDLARMGVLGEPDAELEDLLAEVEAVQQAAFSKVRAGAPGGEVGARALEVMAAGPSGGLQRVLRAWHGADQPRGAVPDAEPHVRPGRCRAAAGGRHGAVGGDDDAASAARVHQARGHAGGHGGRDTRCSASAGGAGTAGERSAPEPIGCRPSSRHTRTATRDQPAPRQ